MFELDVIVVFLLWRHILKDGFVLNDFKLGLEVLGSAGVSG
jgi:hypothetical protein